ncbi:MAG TPA: hypothetical protein VGL94_18760 [Ktedonobacteraceae bacterium]
MPLPDEIAQTTEALEELPRMFGYRNILDGQHEHMLQDKQTDVLPSLTLDNSATVTWWQARQFREENEYLRPLPEQQRAEMQLLITEYNNLKGDFDREIASIHHKYQQEIAYQQQHLHNVIAEHNYLHDAYEKLEDRYQELFHNFQECVEEEVQRKIMEATQTVIQAPEQAPVLFQHLVKTIELQYRQEEDKYLAEALYLKREVYRIAQLLENERQQLKAEHQQLSAQQYSVQEQTELRQKTLQARLQARWKIVSVVTSLGFVTSLVIFQFVFLSLFHVHLTAAISLSIMAPILLCIVLALVLATPVGLLRYTYLSAPHKKKVKQE